MSADGTVIAGRAHGAGPPVVLIHGGAGDGEASWRTLLPFLGDRFRWYALSTRGRGLSADHPDRSLRALTDDVVAFVEAIGEPAGVFGHSSSLALAAAARTPAIVAVAVHEPAVPALDHDGEDAAIERMMAAAAAGRHAEAAGIFFAESGLFTDGEVDALASSGAYDVVAPNVPVWCAEMAEYAGAVDPAVLEEVRFPVLLLRGTDTAAWFAESVAFVADRLAGSRVRDIAGGGHMAPLLRPAEVARELTDFFDETLPSAG
ncbi:alpha/beta fold hydrolase [Trujillonella humicola]|uniref:alpha/beta fold hydrolase n=1 Tax=Trujillonella humicola TaxID=3383699 RepID=UPI00390674EB